MSQIPATLLYTKEHEWIQVLEDGTATIGITDYAQESLGDITYVEFPTPGESFGRADTFGVVESVKAASDLYMPINAQVLEINKSLEEEPELLNTDPYEKGWLLKIRITDNTHISELLNADAYADLI